MPIHPFVSEAHFVGIFWYLSVFVGICWFLLVFVGICWCGLFQRWQSLILVGLSQGSEADFVWYLFDICLIFVWYLFNICLIFVLYLLGVFSSLAILSFGGAFTGEWGFICWQLLVFAGIFWYFWYHLLVFYGVVFSKVAIFNFGGSFTGEWGSLCLIAELTATNLLQLIWSMWENEEKVFVKKRDDQM